ncbi:hypothetical protein [Pontimicrobium aquaticum]|uniref:Uncharacterized protein n=1 Tax=Pontimicrobium aquaticum TaxID=2565367 RepID=A0A4U0F084_9FLAO|nr:hypothetical protein [Pontimicrobium aquaticum]TJY37756.1 hypothetical protein E5167_00450 [Pontimicrobium aquaticum]
MKKSTIISCFFALCFYIIGNSQSNIDSLLVPIDYNKPNGEKFYLKYQFGDTFNENLSTVFAIADGQQFWARPGRANRFQEETFGLRMNVVVIFGRPNSKIIESHLRNEDNEINWVNAYNLFGAKQWVEDIESVRKKVSPNKKINLYGRSGGGFLLLQYLERYGKYVDKAFCQTALVPKLQTKLGYSYDRFWEEISSYDHNLQVKISQVLKEGYFNRYDVASAFQRQNFFVDSKKINQERKKLIDILFKKNKIAFDSVLKKYQVNAIKRMKPTTMGICSTIRLFEFYTYRDISKVLEGSLGKYRPDMEMIKIDVEPLIKELKKGNIELPSFSLSNLRNINTQVFLFAGRWDHVVDYRGQYYLNGLIPNSLLFLADDNHVFSSIYSTDSYKKLVQYSLLYDLDSPKMKQLLEETKKLRWREWESN